MIRRHLSKFLSLVNFLCYLWFLWIKLSLVWISALLECWSCSQMGKTDVSRVIFFSFQLLHVVKYVVKYHIATSKRNALEITIFIKQKKKKKVTRSVLQISFEAQWVVVIYGLYSTQFLTLIYLSKNIYIYKLDFFFPLISEKKAFHRAQRLNVCAEKIFQRRSEQKTSSLCWFCPASSHFSFKGSIHLPTYCCKISRLSIISVLIS